jgi:competence protein ComEA
MNKVFTAAALVLALAAPAVAQDKPAAATGQVGATAPAIKSDTKTVPPTPVKAESKLVNINTATAAELDALTKGPHAKAIIGGRPYKTVEELASKKVIPQDAYDAIKGKVTVK